MSLPPKIDDIVSAHHDGFLYDLFGESLGLPLERVAELRSMGILPDIPVPILARAGLDVLAARPLMMAMMIGAAKQSMEPGRRKQADRWPAKKWAKQIIRDAPSVSSPPPTIPSVTPIGGDTPDLPPPPPPPPTGSGGGGPKPPDPPDFLTDLQRHSWTQARERAGSFVRGLGNIVTAEAETTLAEVWNGEQIERETDADKRAEVVDIIREETAAATANNTKWRSSTAQKLASNLAHRTGDWSRNWERIARTELQGAYNEGSVLEAIEWDGPDALIARIPEPSACADCRRVHMTRDGRPRVFKASDLINNGTNVGRKRAQWQATIWPVHPNCRCDTQHIPEGMEFDDEWGLVYKAYSFSQLANLVKAKGYLYKAGPFIGPRGGKWADAKHTIAWKEKQTTRTKGHEIARLPPEVQSEIAGAVTFVTRLFPELQDVRVVIADHDLGHSHATKDSKKIKLNPTTWLDVNKLKQQRDEAAGLVVDGSIKGIIVHELGHILAGRILNALGSKKYNEIAQKHLGVPQDGLDPWGEPVFTTLSNSDMPSAYAMDNRSEYEAEAFSAAVFGKAETNPKWAAGAVNKSKAYWADMLHAYRNLSKSLAKSGPYIGPRGGKWADAKHTIAWKEKSKRQLKREASEKRKKARASAEGPAVEAYNKAVKDHNEHDDAGYDANASDMVDVAYGGYAPAKIDAMKVWAKKVGLEVGETDFSGGASYGSAYIQLKVPGIGAVGGSGRLDRAVVVRMSDHGNMARVGGRLQTDTNIAPDFGWTFMKGIGHAIGILRERFQEHLDNADDDDYFDQDPDGDAERKRMEEAMPLLDKLGKLYRKPG